MNIIITVLTTMNVLNVVLIGIIVVLGAILVMVLEDNQTMVMMEKPIGCVAKNEN